MTLKLADNRTSITGIDIDAAQKHYNAKYVMDTCVNTNSGGWVGPVALFYGPTEHPVSKSRYFALRVMAGRGDDHERQTVYIMNGQTAVDHVYEGLVYKDEVYHSRHRHDFRAVGPDFIDGGLDYTRLVGLTLPIVKFTIVDGEPVFQEQLRQNDMAARYPNKVEQKVAIDGNLLDDMFDQYDHNSPGKFWK